MFFLNPKDEKDSSKSSSRFVKLAATTIGLVLAMRYLPKWLRLN
jgi:hypothetical protein